MPRRDKVRALLSGLAAGHRPLTHAALDELPGSKTLRHLRSVLVASGALPARDEHLTRLEHWIRQAVTRRPDAGQKHLLHSYATWQVLRRLRQRARATPVTQHQASTAKENVTAAMAFLDWLDARGLTLATCAQGDLDAWMVGASTAQKGRTGHFVRWARSRKHTRLDFPATRWNGPTRTLDTEARWDQARRLLHDEALKPEDRFAGLPAQPPCSSSPPRSRPPSSPACSASTSTSPSHGSTPPTATGPPTPPTSAAGTRRSPFRHVAKHQPGRDRSRPLPGMRRADARPRPLSQWSQGLVLQRAPQISPLFDDGDPNDA